MRAGEGGEEVVERDFVGEVDDGERGGEGALVVLLAAQMLSSPRVRSKRLRGAMRGGLWSSFSVLGAGRLSSDEVNCDTRQALGSGWPSDGFTPLQAKPAWASWSAVRALPKESCSKTAG